MSNTSKDTHFARLKTARAAGKFNKPTVAPTLAPAGIPTRHGDWRIYPNGAKVFDPIPQLPPVNPYATFNRN